MILYLFRRVFVKIFYMEIYVRLSPEKAVYASYNGIFRNTVSLSSWSMHRYLLVISYEE